MKVALIPARGGSKRIPRKNIKPFCGKPMLVRAIEAAFTAGIFDKVIVSTDDQEIADMAVENGAWVPFIRPQELADDYAPTRVVVNHALEWLENNGHQVSHCCCLYATSPFVTGEILKDAWIQLDNSDKDFCFSATSFAYPIQRAFYFDETGNIAMFNESKFSSRSQDLVEAFHDAGQFYWGKTEAFLSDEPMFSAHASAFLLPRYRVHDIDTPEDWETAEIIFSALASQAQVKS